MDGWMDGWLDGWISSIVLYVNSELRFLFSFFKLVEILKNELIDYSIIEI